MIGFWLLIGLMCAVALAIIVVPVFLRCNQTTVTEQQLSLALYQQRLKELETEKNNGELTVEEFDQAYIELQKNLLQETDRIVPSLKQPRDDGCYVRRRSLWIVALATLLIIAAVALYLKIGASQELQQYRLAQKNAADIDAEIIKLGSLQNIISHLKQQVEKKPDSRGWFLLGRLYLKAQQYQNAVAALAQANQLAPDQVEIMMSYAEALYLASDNVLNQQAQNLLQNILKLQPQQPNAINLLALNAYQQKNYQQAIHYWQQLLTQFPPDSPSAKELLQMIASAQQKMASESPVNPAVIKLPVIVTIAADLKNKIQGNESLFVFAQAVNGPPMPLAVVRRSVKDLPLHVVLDEKMAMMANLSLADFKEVRVIARISKSGQPLPSAGDLEGKSAIIQTRNPPAQITVVIDKLT